MTFKINPKSEIDYRMKLAECYLMEAEDAYRRGDFRGTVASSQLATENAAKAVISVYRMPSWSHDPSHELREIANQIPQNLKPSLEEIAEIAGLLAPEHGRAVYGEPMRGLTPWEIYVKRDAELALQRAKRAIELARILLMELGVRGAL
jgi:HEPN domain-containing protein